MDAYFVIEPSKASSDPSVPFGSFPEEEPLSAAEREAVRAALDALAASGRRWAVALLPAFTAAALLTSWTMFTRLLEMSPDGNPLDRMVVFLVAAAASAFLLPRFWLQASAISPPAPRAPPRPLPPPRRVRATLKATPPRAGARFAGDQRHVSVHVRFPTHWPSAKGPLVARVVEPGAPADAVWSRLLRAPLVLSLHPISISPGAGRLGWTWDPANQIWLPDGTPHDAGPADATLSVDQDIRAHRVRAVDVRF